MDALTNRFLEAVSNWPIIMQGALGSALFATIVFIGQKIYSYVSIKFSELSKIRRLEFLKEECTRCFIHTSDHVSTIIIGIISLFLGSFRKFLKGMAWLTLGLLGTKVSSLLGVIGFLGCLYYIFSALNTLRRYQISDYQNGKMEELEAELEQLQKTGE